MWGGGERKGGEEVDRMALQRAPPGTPASLHCMSHVDWKKKIVQHKCGEGCFIHLSHLGFFSAPVSTIKYPVICI